jgi:hypothetical protein
VVKQRRKHVSDDTQRHVDEVPADSAPVDGTVSTNNPHPVDENPEDHVGDEQSDPWSPENRKEWTKAPLSRQVWKVMVDDSAPLEVTPQTPEVSS